MKRWSAGGRVKRTSPSGPISDAAIIAFSTYSSWLSKLRTIELVSTRSSAKPPISSSSADPQRRDADHPPRQRADAAAADPLQPPPR